MSKGESEDRSYLPHCWHEEQRMQSLFSSFRKKELNPIAWQNKMNFWIELIDKFSQTRKMAVITSQDICVAFERNKKYPACIEEVLDYMYRENIITTVEKYTCHHLPKSWLSWSYNSFVKYPLYQGWSTIRDTFFVSPTSQKFVVLNILKDLANLVFDKHKALKISSNVDNVMLLEDFQKYCIDICEGENFRHALMQLQHDNKVKVFEEPDGLHIIKFKENQNDKLEVSNVDRAVLRLQKVMSQNLEKIDKITAEQNRCIARARQFANQDMKERAKMMLKKKIRMESDVKKSFDIQNNLETMLLQVQNCTSEKMILDAYNAGADALKSCLSTDLALHHIDESMDEIKQVIDDAIEVQTALAGNISDEGDEFDLEDELKEIMNTDASFKQKAEIIEERNLPKPEVSTKSDKNDILDFSKLYSLLPASPKSSNSDISFPICNEERKDKEKEAAA